MLEGKALLMEYVVWPDWYEAAQVTDAHRHQKSLSQVSAFEVSSGGSMARREPGPLLKFLRKDCTESRVSRKSIVASSGVSMCPGMDSGHVDS